MPPLLPLLSEIVVWYIVASKIRSKVHVQVGICRLADGTIHCRYNLKGQGMRLNLWSTTMHASFPV